MSKTQINLRASDMTVRQIDELQATLGMSKTELVTLAIDRLYNTVATMPLDIVEDEMSNSKHTIYELASDELLWAEYIDPDDNAPFDSLSLDERVALIRECWPSDFDEDGDPLWN